MATEKKDDAPSLPQDPEVLATSIEQTREDLAHTLDEIADKVSPKRVTRRATKKVADTAKDKAATVKEVVAEKAADAKDAVLDAKDAAVDKVSELTHHDEPDGVDVMSVHEPVVNGAYAPGPVLTDQPLRPTTSDPYATADAGVPKEYLAAGGAAAVVLLLLLLRRRRKHRR